MTIDIPDELIEDAIHYNRTSGHAHHISDYVMDEWEKRLSESEPRDLSSTNLDGLKYTESYSFDSGENTVFHDKFSHPVGSPCKICQPDKMTEGFCKLMEEMGVKFVDANPPITPKSGEFILKNEKGEL